MASKVGGIFADFDLNQAGFESGLKKADSALMSSAVRMNRTFARIEKGAGRIGGAMRRMAKSINPLKAGLAGALGSAGFIAATKAALTTADATAKMADRMGVATSALQEWRHGADLAGISADDFDKAIVKLNQRVGLFTTTGISGSKDAFDAMGLSPDILSGKLAGTEAIFDRIVKKLEAVKSQAERAGLASGIFGDKLGPKLTLLLDQGSAGIARMRKEARDLGIVIESDLLRNAEVANDKLSTLARVLKAQVVSALVSAAPHIAEFGQALAQRLPALIAGVKDFAKYVGLIAPPPEMKAFKQAERDVIAAGAALDAFKGKLEDLANQRSRLADMAGNGSVFSGNAQAGLSQIDADIEDYKARHDAALDVARAASAKWKQAQSNIWNTGALGPSAGRPDVIKPGALMFPGGGGTSKKPKKSAFETAADGMRKQIQAQKDLTAEAGVTGAALTAMRATQTAFNAVMAKGKTVTEAQTAEILGYRSELLAAAEAAEAAAKKAARPELLGGMVDDLDARIASIRDETAAIGIATAARERMAASRELENRLIAEGIALTTEERHGIDAKLAQLEREAAKRDALRKKEEERQAAAERAARKEEELARRVNDGFDRMTASIGGVIAKTKTMKDVWQSLLTELVSGIGELAKAAFLGNNGGAANDNKAGGIGGLLAGLIFGSSGGAKGGKTSAGNSGSGITIGGFGLGAGAPTSPATPGINPDANGRIGEAATLGIDLYASALADGAPRITDIAGPSALAALDGLGGDIRSGLLDVVDSAASGFDALISSVVDGLSSLFDQASSAGGSGGGGGGGFFSSILGSIGGSFGGGGGGGGSLPVSGFGVMHSGGRVGAASIPQRKPNSAGLLKIGPRERMTILEEGETVLPRGASANSANDNIVRAPAQSASTGFGGGGRGDVVIYQTITIDARGADAGSEERFRAALAQNKRETLAEARQAALNDVAAQAHLGGSFARAVGRRP